MMAYQIGDPLHLRFGHAGIGQKGPDDGRTFFFLQFSVSTAVFFTAEGTGNVVDDGGRFQQILGVRVQPFQLADGLGIGPYGDEMGNVVKITVRKDDHLFHELRNGFHL